VRNIFIGVLCLSRLAFGQYSAPAANNDANRLKIPTESVAPTGFDYGKMSEQGNLNEYRIGKLEEDVKKVNSLIDSARGAWWAMCGAFVVLVTLTTVGVRFVGKHIALAFVEHYGEARPPTTPTASS
jgi:hypothetical protein